jgi:hypothetical protein
MTTLPEPTMPQLAKSSPTTRMALTIRRIGTAKLFLLAAAMSLASAILFVILFQWLISATGAGQASWATLEGITSVVSTSLLFGGGIFVYLEYIESEEARRQAEQDTQIAEMERTLATRERQKQEYIMLVDRLMNEDEQAIRRWILHNIKAMRPDEDREMWIANTREMIFRNPNEHDDPAIGQKNIKHVLNVFDSLGFVVLNFSTLHEDERLMDWLNPMVSKVWERIGPYIEEEAERRNEPQYYLWARRLGTTCTDWRVTRSYPTSKFVDDAL